MNRFSLLLCAGLLSACAGLDVEEYSELEEGDRAAILKLDEKLNSLHFEIATMVQQGNCDTDFQCRSLPVGEKPCGGPRYYYPYSVSSMNNSVLMGKVTEYGRLDKERNIKLNADVSNCVAVRDPGARCVARKCMAQ
ncbi:MAG: hypothetical protein A2V90_05875 [Gammaproteobacteria bacterium RBG_16_57_12]|nr:MAG: hypothetical protein A2V90_05875 [Gammaproteobacteria bacterium RBG_16_57_12]